MVTLLKRGLRHRAICSFGYGQSRGTEMIAEEVEGTLDPARQLSCAVHESGCGPSRTHDDVGFSAGFGGMADIGSIPVRTRRL
jgi:hypothetical protein